MQINRQVVAGNLAETAEIRSISESRDILSMRIISNERWTDDAGHEQNRSVSHSVIRFGPRGSFNEFVAKSLQVGMPVMACGRVDRESNVVNNETYRNVTIDTSAEGGYLSPLQDSMQLNKHEIMGYLIEDAVLRDAGGNQGCLSFVVATTVSEYYNGQKHEHTALHPVVKFDKKAKLARLAEKLKTGAGVYFTGKTDKRKSQSGDQTYYNAQVDVSYSPLQIFRYVTPKPMSQPKAA